MQTGTDSVDKNIVERRRMGNAARAALKNSARPKGGSDPDANAFQGELLQRHAEIQRRLYVPALPFIVSLAWMLWIGWPDPTWMAWAILPGLVAVWRIYGLAQFSKLDSIAGETKRWTARFNVMQTATGLACTVIILIVVSAAPTQVMWAALFGTAAVLVAASLLTSHNLKFGVLLTSFPASLVLAGALAIQMTPFAITMAASLCFLTFLSEFIAAKLRRATVAQLHAAVVRDQLIVDLEAATAISDEARRRAEEANLAKSRFLATMSHELRTPLNAILGFSEVMSNEVMGPLNNDFYKEYVGDIHRSGSHLLKLINEILDLSRIEAGRYEMNEEPVSLPDAVEEAQQMMKLKAKQKHISIILQLQPNLPDLSADARAVRQIVLNLLSNALKFTPEGGTVWLKAGWTAGGGQYISIKDSGPGIPEDEIPVVLSSFGQGSIAIKSAEQGTGLGLPIVQALVHMHQGHFELKSRLREGTEVIATFPKARVLASGEMPMSGPLHRVSGNQPFATQRMNVTAPPLVGVGGVDNVSMEEKTAS